MTTTRTEQIIAVCELGHHTKVESMVVPQGARCGHVDEGSEVRCDASFVAVMESKSAIHTYSSATVNEVRYDLRFEGRALVLVRTWPTGNVETQVVNRDAVATAHFDGYESPEGAQRCTLAGPEQKVVAWLLIPDEYVDQVIGWLA